MSDASRSTDPLSRLLDELQGAVNTLGTLADQEADWSKTVRLGDADGDGLDGVFDLQIRTGLDAERRTGPPRARRSGTRSTRHRSTRHRSAGGRSAGGRSTRGRSEAASSTEADSAAEREVPVEERREPAVDVFDEGDHLLVVAEMPGAGADQVEPTLNGDLLTLTAATGARTYATEVLLPRAPTPPLEVEANNGIVKILCPA
jgi:HSP20 family molecular chaperone IbpA